MYEVGSMLDLLSNNSGGESNRSIRAKSALRGGAKKQNA